MSSSDAAAALVDPSAFPGLPQRNVDDVVLRLWLFSHGSPGASWTVYRRNHDVSVRRVVAPPEGPVADEASMSAQTVDEIFKWLGNSQVPPFPGRWFAMEDGDMRGLVVRNNWVKSRYTWLGPAPKGWKPLALWHERTIFTLQQRLPDSIVPFEVSVDHTIHEDE